MLCVIVTVLSRNAAAEDVGLKDEASAMYKGIERRRMEITYLYIQFEVTRFGDPLSHSGMNVMKPRRRKDIKSAPQIM